MHSSFVTAASRFKPGGKAFAAWLKAAGTDSKAVLMKSEMMGYGLAAAEPIQAGETALSIPPAVWRPFSADHAIERALQGGASGFVDSVRGLEASLVKTAGASSAPEHLTGCPS
jgi:hypothetical protein